MSILPHWHSLRRASTLLLFCAISQLLLACGADAFSEEEADPASAEPVELGKLEQHLDIIYENTYMRDGYGKEDYGWGQPDQCNWSENWPDYFGGCRVPAYKTIKVKVMPHDYDGCYGEFWRDALKDAMNLWNYLHTSYSTGFQFQEVTTGEHVKAYCDVDLPSAGKTRFTEQVCTQHTPGTTTYKGLCKEKKWLVRLGGNHLVNSGATLTGIRNIAMHEFGHVLGLAHTSVPGVMGPWVGDVNVNGQAPSLTQMDWLWAYCPGNGVIHCDGASRPW